MNRHTITRIVIGIILLVAGIICLVQKNTSNGAVCMALGALFVGNAVMTLKKK